MEPNPELSVWEGCDESITGGCICERDVGRGIFDCAGASRATVWCPILWHGSAALPLDTATQCGLWCRICWGLRWPSWHIPRPDIKFCRVGCLKTYYFFLSIFNPQSMSLSFALSCIFYISSALIPSPSELNPQSGPRLEPLSCWSALTLTPLFISGTQLSPSQVEESQRERQECKLVSQISTSTFVLLPSPFPLIFIFPAVALTPFCARPRFKQAGISLPLGTRGIYNIV